MNRKNQKALWIILGVLVVVLIIVFNWLTIRDWWVLRTYEPPQEIVRLADNSFMSEQGREHFYASTPELNDAEEFNQNCQVPEAGIVLGCYVDWKIFVFRMMDERLQGVEEVTAAHEMLHAAYIRLTARERRDINDLLDIQLQQITNQQILDNLQFYQETAPENIQTEMFAIFGTELRPLIPELEEIYKTYFTDRNALVAISESYADAFNALVDQLEDCNENLPVRVDALNTEADRLNSELADIEAQRAYISTLDPEEDQEEILELTEDLNAQIEQYNKDVLDYQIAVDQYNSDLNQCNELALSQLNILFNLDSSLQTMQPQSQ